MKSIQAIAVSLILAFASSLLHAADWKPADGPLMTKWAKDVSPDNVLPEYPRPQMVREKWMNLNGMWQFEFMTEGATVIFGRDLNDQILVPFAPESALSGIMKHDSPEMLYRRMIQIPEEWGGQRVLLHFGAVDWQATVYVNGKSVGTHRGGYDPFTFDVTDALKPEGEQELVVWVFDPTDKGFQPIGKQRIEPKGIFYTPTSGIWQTVWIEPVPASYIRGLTITPDLATNEVEIYVDSVGGSNVPDGKFFEYSVFDGEKRLTQLPGPSGIVRLPMANAKLWSPESPHLYRLQVRCDTDTVESYFAMRKIEMKKDDKGVNRLFLNDKPVFQIGLLDQGFWPDGLYTAPTDEALKSDIEVTKQLGFNMARKHVKVEPARWYFWADKLGLLVWQDMPSTFNEKPTDEAKQNFEAEWKSVMDALRNHPSIVMWVVFNEGWGQYETERLTQWTKGYDPTRLVNNASGWTDANVGDVIDMHVYPGPGAPKTEPNRAAVLGEFGGLGLHVEGHHWTKNNFSYSGMESVEELEDEYARLFGRLWLLHRDAGLSAAVYTQTTDVEGEINGLLTYDRELKVDLNKIKDANEGRVALMKTAVVIPTSKEEPQTWKYTFDKPADDWAKPAFDDTSWKSGPGGFGTEGTPGATVRTKWDTTDIWLRRTVKLPADVDLKRLIVTFHHDEACEIYFNGALAARAKDHVGDYREKNVRNDALKAIKPGKDVVIAVHCNQTAGGQFIDMGVVRVVPE